jgi:hypothetical protein
MISPDWPNVDLVTCFSTTINDPKDMPSHDYGFNQENEAQRIIAIANRKRLMTDLGASEIQWMNQVHGNIVFNVNNVDETELPEGDGCWTTQSGMALSVLTADCLPVVIVSKKGDWLGVAHAGWRGLAKGVLEALISRADVDPGQLDCWIGPGISQHRYTVGEEVWSVFDDLHSCAVDKKSERLQNKRLLNLSSIAASQLIDGGVGQVYQSGICTYDDPRFFSVRRNNGSSRKLIDGRLATVALLKRSIA